MNDMNYNGNPVLQIITQRSSLRKFSSVPLTKAEEEAILYAAMRAPTAANLMLYSILIVRDKEVKKKLSVSCNQQAWIETAPFLLIFLADMQRLEDFYAYCKVAEKCEELGLSYTAPGEQNLLLASCDALLAAQNAVLAAESMDIGSCYIGHIMDHYEFHRELFKLPPYVFPITMLAFGKAPKEFHRKPSKRRFNKKTIVHENSYHRMNEEELEQAFQSFPYTSRNTFHAENNGQFHYLSRHSCSDCYEEGIRSVRVALKNWQ
ncbi:nitroreductase [bacterium 1XD21-13]|nr:nitroreductase [bacterium 1XD21-13]